MRSVLLRAREHGLVGPGAIEQHLSHASDFADAVTSVAREAHLDVREVVDLGSGAGLPGLVMAILWDAVRFVLVESSARRVELLVAAIDELGLRGRVDVAGERAERVGRSNVHRGRYDAVVARGFGRPAVTAECAAPLLRTGGVLVVSAPPAPDTGAARAAPAAGGLPAEVLPADAPSAGAGAIGDVDRWPAARLGELNMEPIGEVRLRFGFVALRQVAPCPQRYPRRVGVPAKRPLF